MNSHYFMLNNKTDTLQQMSVSLLSHVCTCNEQALDELEAKNQRLVEEHSCELKTLELAATEKQKLLMETHQSTVQDLTHHREQDLQAAKQQAKKELAQLRQVVCRIVWEDAYSCLFLS